ncbi:MAG: type II CAAX endopeptidase family protein [Vagococcus sp.]|uniref:CPBP family intramembrane glutamic endopeptidase n=1 Tax=Vagococcus sp. TaxID=1933889 RepID=UPI002FC96046
MKLTQSMEITKKELGEKSPWSTLGISLVLFLFVPIMAPLILFPIVSSFDPSLTFMDLFEKEPFRTNVNLFSFPFVLLVFLLIHKIKYKKSFESLGFVAKDKWKKYGTGLLLGFGGLLVVYGINFLFGSVTVHTSANFNLLAFLLILVGFLIQGMTEEVLMRSFIMNAFSSKKGVVWGILVNSLFFSVFHLMNPGVTVLSIVNIFIFGLIFSLLFYWSDNIWLTGAAHSAWNFTMGPIMGIQVSGQTFQSTLFETASISSKHLINGGTFGLEGGLVTTVCGIILCLVLWKLCQKKGLID